MTYLSNTDLIMNKRPARLRMAASVILLFSSLVGYGQEGKDPAKKKEWEGDGEIENVEIEIVKERQIILPEANRNFDKIPPRASEPIKPPISYDFKSVNF